MKKSFLFGAIVFALLAGSAAATTVKLKGRMMPGISVVGTSTSVSGCALLANPCTAGICGTNSICTPQMNGSEYTGYYYCSCSTGGSPTSDGKNCL